jgi:hypothetical protein
LEQRFPFDLKFRFNVSQWRACVVAPVPVPYHEDIKLWVDPAYFADPDSNDQSALAATFKNQTDAGNILTVVDAQAGWFKGMALPDRIVTMAHKHHATEIRIERNGNGAPDLLEDVINLRAQEQGITLGRITLFNPNNKDAAKRRRVFKLQGLLDSDPPTVQFCRGAYVSPLLEQVENFRFDRDDNSGREDGLLDIIALAAFGR